MLTLFFKKKKKKRMKERINERNPLFHQHN